MTICHLNITPGYTDPPTTPSNQPDQPILKSAKVEFYHTELYSLLKRINAYLVRWIRRKYKRLAGFKKAKKCWVNITKRYPRMFTQWRWTRAFW